MAILAGLCSGNLLAATTAQRLRQRYGCGGMWPTGRR